jgi:flagellar export protein FliJ
MSIFKFRLATLLKLRETVRDQRRAQLAEAYRAERAINDQIAGIAEQSLLAQEECRRTAGPGTVDPARLIEAARYAAALSAREARLREELATVRADVDQRRREYAEAHRDVRVLRTFRDRQAESYRLDAEHRETRHFDEVAQQVFLRNRFP